MTLYMHSAMASFQRFYSEGDVIQAEPGCYVDGSMSMRACTWKAIGVAFGLGAVSQERYSQLSEALLTWVDEDGSETYTEIGNQVEEALNAANASPAHCWRWDAGDLIYQEVEE